MEFQVIADEWGGGVFLCKAWSITQREDSTVFGCTACVPVDALLAVALPESCRLAVGGAMHEVLTDSCRIEIVRAAACSILQCYPL